MTTVQVLGGAPHRAHDIRGCDDMYIADMWDSHISAMPPASTAAFRGWPRPRESGMVRRCCAAGKDWKVRCGACASFRTLAVVSPAAFHSVVVVAVVSALVVMLGGGAGGDPRFCGRLSYCAFAGAVGLSADDVGTPERLALRVVPHKAPVNS